MFEPFSHVLLSDIVAKWMVRYSTFKRFADWKTILRVTEMEQLVTGTGEYVLLKARRCMMERKRLLARLYLTRGI